MEKKNLPAIVGGCVVGAIALGVLWMLASAIGRTSDAGARLADAESRLNTLYRSKMFPSQTNQLVAAQDVRRIQDWLASVTNRLHQGDVQVQAWLTPSSLKQAMIDLTKDQKIQTEIKLLYIQLHVSSAERLENMILSFKSLKMQDMM